MKKIITLTILTAFLIACGGSEPTPTKTTNNITTQTPATPAPPADPGTPEIILATYDGNAVKFYDGDTFTVWKTGHAVQADTRIISVDTVLYYLDAFGQTISSISLPATPDFISLHGSDVYIFQKISPADALSMGAQFKHYTRVYKNGLELGNWFLNQWETIETRVTISDVTAITPTGAVHAVTGSYSNIFTAIENGPFIIDYDSGARTANFKTTGTNNESWATNYMSNAKYWQEADVIFYSNNGYEYSDTDGLTENANALARFNSLPFPVTIPNGEFPVVISSGANFENSETVLYWIECNTGNLFRYIPSVDQLNQVSRLYMGNGMRVTGLSYAENLKPVMIEGVIYYHDQGNIYKCETSTGNISVFHGADVLIWGMK